MPSGHASLSAYACIVFCFYLQRRVAVTLGARMTLLIVELFVVTCALLISASRVADYYHQCVDVAKAIFSYSTFSCIDSLI